MAYNAKTDWKHDDNITEDDVNRWEQGIADAHEKAEEIEEDVDNLQQEITAHQADYMPHDSELNQYASGVDGNGIYTVIDYKRPDGTLYLKSTASNPDSNGYYQTITWDFYESDGATVAITKTWTITYDEDGVPTSKEVE